MNTHFLCSKYRPENSIVLALTDLFGNGEDGEVYENQGMHKNIGSEEVAPNVSEGETRDSAKPKLKRRKRKNDWLFLNLFAGSLLQKC